ncbi:MAG: hypothetical protein OEM24_04100 [Paracoccaceae bacterium]|nr:hypothetical protein [Paracoccaceae bacterium]
MAQLPKSRTSPECRLGFVALQGGAGASVAPRPPAHLGLRRAAEIVEGAAYDLAGTASPVFISRLIEIAAELDRHARTRQDGAEFGEREVAFLVRD